MRYLYKATDTITGMPREESFDDLAEAEYFADDNSEELSDYKIIDTEHGLVVYSPKIAEERINEMNDIMFPDEDSEE